MYTALDFFAGSGLVRLGLSPHFETLWANDNSAKKRATYIANHPQHEFHLADIQSVRGEGLPSADLAWASFPCQDLSLAGNLKGIHSGTRSGLFWEWMRILQEMKSLGNLPPILVAENVVGFVVADQGKHFIQAYSAIRELGYRLGAIVVNAEVFLPQSRPRAFVIAVSRSVPLDGLVQRYPSGPFHPTGLIRTSFAVEDPGWVWWTLPFPKERRPAFSDLCDRSAQCDSQSKTEELLEMMSPANKRKLDAMRRTGEFFAGTAYRRMRPSESGEKVQRLETRFDGVAGCLRTPNGGSSRQTVVLVDRGVVRSRLMTARECARLMGAPDTYRLEGSYNDAYRAMGDAVAVPVTRWITRHLLAPLAERSRRIFKSGSPSEQENLSFWCDGAGSSSINSIILDLDA